MKATTSSFSFYNFQKLDGGGWWWEQKRNIIFDRFGPATTTATL
jgi:hypothetical protein